MAQISSSALRLWLSLSLFWLLPLTTWGQQAADLSQPSLPSLASEVSQAVRKYPETAPLFLRLASEIERLESQLRSQSENSSAEVTSLKLQLSELKATIQTLETQQTTWEASQTQLDAEWRKELSKLEAERDRMKMERNLSLGAFGLALGWAIIK